MKFNSVYKGILYGEQNEMFWKSSSALTEKELREVQNFIFELQQKGLPSAKIIAKIQEYNSKLTEKYRAERVFWTEVKRRESKQVVDVGEELEIEKFRVILSPHACNKCIKMFKGKTLTSKQIADGKDVPPAHPNCYCAILPI